MLQYCIYGRFILAAENEGIAMDYDAARETIYGMPYNEWKSNFQQPATEAQLRQFTEKNDQ